jgi:hypothetical protein
LAWSDVVAANGGISHHQPAVVVWLDPGATTGWARWDVYAAEFRSGEDNFTGTGQLMNLWLSYDETWLGWEAFTIRPGSSRMKQDGSSWRVIGMLEWLAFRHRATVIKPQNPDARTLGLKNLKRVGWHAPGKDHANDAAAHLLSFLIRYHVTPLSFRDLLASGPDV